MEDLSKIVETLAANNQKLRVAVTKTSAQGEEAQKATPNMMSFSKDENNIWFNDKVYGVIYFKYLHTLNNDSTNEEITKIIGAPTQEHFNHLYDFIIQGGIISIMEQYDFYPCICNINNGETKSLLLKTINYRDKLNYERYLFTLVDNTWKCNIVRRIIIEDIISDIYKSALGTSVQMPNTVGGIAAGTTVACIKNTSTTEHTEANWDPLGGTVDLSAYATKAEMNSGLNSKINTSAIKNDLTTGGVTNVYLPNKVRY